MDVYAGFELNDALGLSVVLLFQLCILFHRCREDIVCCCGGRYIVWCLVGMRVGRFLESSADFVVLVRFLAFQFAVLLSVLLC